MTEQRSLRFEFEPVSISRAAEALALAERLRQSHDPRAESAFAEAENLAIKCADMEMQMRAFEKSGRFHEECKAFTISLQKYHVALQSAECLLNSSDSGIENQCRLRFRILAIHNREKKALENLKHAAGPTDTYESRLQVWDDYENEVLSPAGRLAARGLGSRDDFRRRLDAWKSERHQA